jgi:hypothetical protein
MMEERRGNPQLRAALSWADRRHLISVRSAVVGATFWLVWDVTARSFAYAHAAAAPSLELAAVIGANTAPVSLLAGAVFRFYMAAKDGNP